MAEDQQIEQTTEKRKLPMKTMMVVAALLLAEGGLVIGLVMFFNRPNEVRGQGLAIVEPDSDAALTEVLIVNDKFPNHHTGRVFLWDVEVQIQVTQKHLDYVTRTVEERSAELKTAIGRLIRGAHHNHLKEPDLQTLTRQLQALLHDVFGQDADGNERVARVLVPKCVGFPADF